MKYFLALVLCLLEAGTSTGFARTQLGEPQQAATASGGDYEEGLKWEKAGQATVAYGPYSRAAAAGSADAAYRIGSLLERGLIESNAAESLGACLSALAWYEKAAEGGSVPAELKMADWTRTGRATPLDLTAASNWYQKVLAQKAQASRSQLAEARSGLKKIASDARAQQVKSASVPTHQVETNPVIVPAGDYEEGLRWEKAGNPAVAYGPYSRAAAAGNADAAYRIGNLYERGLIGTDAAESLGACLSALIWYQRAADGGNVPAELKMADWARTGRASPVDLIASSNWYQKVLAQKAQASSSQLAEARSGLKRPASDARAQQVTSASVPTHQVETNPVTTPAGDYEEGLTWERAGNPAVALIWYQRAADGGSVPAELKMADWTRTGRATPVDFTASSHWYQKVLIQIQASSSQLAEARSGLKEIEGHQRAADSWNCLAQKVKVDPGQQAIPVPVDSRPVRTIVAASGDQDPVVVGSEEQSNLTRFESTLSHMQTNKVSLSRDTKQAFGSDSYYKSRYKNWLKHCNDWNYVGVNSTISGECDQMARGVEKVTSVANPDAEALRLRECAYSSDSKGVWCERLGKMYVARRDFTSALMAFRKNECDTDGCAEGQAEIYRQFAAATHLYLVNEKLCFDLFEFDACKELRSQGVEIDEDKWLAQLRIQQRESDHEDRRRQRQHDADYAELRHEKAERNAAIVGITTYLAQTAADSYQQYQAGVAQARVNVAVGQMEQQNKAKGGSGYPTTSSGGSSGSSGSSSNSAKSGPKQTPPASSDTSSSDSSSESSSVGSTDTGRSQSFNPYESATSGYNSYSGQGVPSAGATNPGETGHWVEAELDVTCWSKSAPHANITLVLVDLQGNLDCHGGYVQFFNPDKTHRLFYGFASVVNGAIEANSTKTVRWPAPYLARNRENPPFQAHVTIRYFSAN